MYGLNSLVIAAVLLASMIGAMEAGYRIGLRRQAAATESSRSHVNGIQASLLGVLALLLGFTFSLALQRFDSRSEAVVDEANAIGTAYLRTKLLPSAVSEQAAQVLQSYTDLRVQAGTVNLAQDSERQALDARADRVLEVLWLTAQRATEADKSPVTSGLYVQAVNEAIDSRARNDAALKRHVPEVILILLYGTFLMTSGVVGYAAGVSWHRPSLVTYIFITLLVILAFIIVDLDRPRRGLIRVDQSSLVALKRSIDADRASIRVPSR